MDKKGMLLVEETLKMIIAVIAIGFLVVFLVSLYFSRVTGDELRQANADIDQIRNYISSSNGNGTILNNPKGWYLLYFVKDKSPNSCAGKECLCVCEKVWAISWDVWNSQDERQFNECNKDGACLGVSGLKSFSEIKIEQVTNIKIVKSEGSVEVSKI